MPFRHLSVVMCNSLRGFWKGYCIPCTASSTADASSASDTRLNHKNSSWLSPIPFGSPTFY